MSVTTQNAPEKAQQLTVKEVLTKGFSYETLVGFGRAPLETVTKEFFTREKGLTEDRKSITEDIKSGFKPLGKVIAAVEQCFSDDYLANRIPQGTTFAAYCEASLGKKLESMGRAAQCRRVFTVLVLGGKLAESDYDNATTDWLTDSVSKILDLAAKKYGNEAYLDAPEIQKMLGILKVRPEKAAKQLREIKNSLAGKTEVEGGELTATKAAELVGAILKGTFNEVPGHVFVATLLRDFMVATETARKSPDLWKRILECHLGFDAETDSACWKERDAETAQQSGAANPALAQRQAEAATPAPAEPVVA